MIEKENLGWVKYLSEAFFKEFNKISSFINKNQLDEEKNKLDDICKRILFRVLKENTYENYFLKNRENVEVKKEKSEKSEKRPVWRTILSHSSCIVIGFLLKQGISSFFPHSDASRIRHQL